MPPAAWTRLRLGDCVCSCVPTVNLTNLVLDPIEEILPEHAAHDAKQSQAKAEYADDEPAVAALPPRCIVLCGHGN